MHWWWMILIFASGLVLGAAIGWGATLLYIGKGMWQ